MTYGGSVALIVIGAILRFAISYSPANLNLQRVGVILMIAGVIGLVVFCLAWMFGRRRRTVTTTRTPNATEVYEERRYTETPLQATWPAGQAGPGPRDGPPSGGRFMSATTRWVVPGHRGVTALSGEPDAA